jgi:3-dehydroquinate synthetase
MKNPVIALGGGGSGDLNGMSAAKLAPEVVSSHSAE